MKRMFRSSSQTKGGWRVPPKQGDRERLIGVLNLRVQEGHRGRTEKKEEKRGIEQRQGRKREQKKVLTKVMVGRKTEKKQKGGIRRTY